MAKKQKIDADWLKSKAEKINDKDFEKVTEKADDIKDKFEKEGPLNRFIEDGKLLISIVKDYWSGKFKKIPWWAISAIVFALLYVFNPLDLVPDFIPGFGFLDDASAIAACLLLVEQQLNEYKIWKEKNSD
jgi:uncharacterized membrane protein YkvA (DUF1232 family)